MRRISSNVVAVVIVMGLAIIPCLYAWFNIFSNWSPYDESSTKNLKVAVVSEDEGVAIKNETVNIGDKIIDNLKGNRSIDWVFLNDGQEAVEGVKSGEYYASFVVEKDFSKNMISFIEGDVAHPEIQYYENDKKNAIAPKITGKVKTTIEKEVNNTFVETLAKSALSISSEIDLGISANRLDDKAAGVFDRTNEDLDALINVLDSYINLYDTASNAAKAVKSVADEIGSMNGRIKSTKDSTHKSIDETKKNIDSLNDLIINSLSGIKADLDLIDSKAKLLYDTAASGSKKINTRLDKIKKLYAAEHKVFDTIRSDIKSLGITVSSSVNDAADNVDSCFDNLNKDITELEKYNTALPEDAKKFYNDCKTDIKKCSDSVDKLKNAYVNDVSRSIDSTVKDVRAKADKALKTLDVKNENLTELVSILDSYPKTSNFGPDKLKKAKENILEIKNKLGIAEAAIGSLRSAEQYSMFMNLLKTDPDAVAGFVTSPVSIKATQLYPYENNGSAMAPFYIVLSIWVGALILVSIVHAKVKKGLIERDFNHVEEFFGRYIFFFIIGQIQTAITVLGALLFVQIQCEHPFLLWVAMSLTSFCFTLLLYSLVFAFGAVGEALAVVMMVLQVAGSGGTFPIEVLPDVYNAMYKYMPFVYSTNAAKETIAGMYGDNYVYNLRILLIYIAVALFIGLILSFPLKKLVAHVKRSTEKTDLIV